MITSQIAVGAAIFTLCCLIQNAMFTWSSRSRNSGDPNYHRFAAWASNGIYFVTNALVTVFIVKYNSLWMLALQGLLYTIAASEGSVWMMKKLLKKEKGKQSVGYIAKYAQIPIHEWNLMRAMVLGDTPQVEGVTGPVSKEIDKDFELARLRKLVAQKGLSTEVKPSESEQGNTTQEGKAKAL